MSRHSQPALIDNQITIETPEGVDLTFQLAGLLPRMNAFAIDTVFRCIPFIIFFMFSSFSKFSEGFLLILYFLMSWFYMVLFEVLSKGQTPGKRFNKIRVIHDDGTNVTWSSSFIRTLLRAVDMLPFGYALGTISLLSNKNFQRLGDLAAGTIVVHITPAVIPHVIPQVEPIKPPVSLTPSEQQAILSFAHRINDFSFERQVELASNFSDYFNCPDDQTIIKVLGMARYMQGQS
ncbi:RDD family protein [Pseudomonas sp. F1_0610]|uniref:RDD family protein n=1 Tax=Pseudomonas sp. F1_0610 TaxID=3114284 RepID=UPI0039C2DF64